MTGVVGDDTSVIVVDAAPRVSIITLKVPLFAKTNIRLEAFVFKLSHPQYHRKYMSWVESINTCCVALPVANAHQKGKEHQSQEDVN